MVCFLDRLKQEKPVYLPDIEDIEKFSSGVLPDGSNVTGSVSMMAFYSDQQKGSHIEFILDLVC